ncbi:hypothetical protein [Streptomyces sp. PR69]|uniref:hypothetical protein n=1 Tax=Streptomyces sp. PR69 TaxID=2984950 RepID=UPI00226522FA|nr:hypothetical protein [Streptomyces sp. PR69]
MGQEPDAAEQLRVVEEAPALGKAANAGERVLGGVSVAALFAGLAGAAASEIPLLLGCVVLAVALALVLGWRWFHLRAPSRRPHSKVEEGIFLFAPVTLALPGVKLLWDNPADLEASAAAAAVPTVVLACYLVLRWRR